MARGRDSESPVDSDRASSAEALATFLRNVEQLGAVTERARTKEPVESQSDYMRRKTQGRDLEQDEIDLFSTRESQEDEWRTEHSVFGVPPSEINDLVTVVVSTGAAGTVLRLGQTLLKQWLENRGTRFIRVSLPDGRELEMRGYSEQEYKRMLNDVVALEEPTEGKT